MDDVNVIYKNDTGIAFIWKRSSLKHFNKINVIFNNTALHFDKDELFEFSKHIKTAVARSLNCKDCCYASSCKSILLETPIPQISFAVNFAELNAIDDLVKGTLFELGLDSLLKDIL